MIIYGVVLVHTTSAAMRSEKVLKQAGCAVKMIPTPRQFSSDCGIAVRFDWAEADSVQRLLEAARVEISSIQPLDHL
jgi:N-acyl-L-homoserine lactone synthetase